MADRFTNPSYSGYLIENLAAALTSANLEVSPTETGLLIRHEPFTTAIDSSPAPVPNCEDATIAEVVTLKTSLPDNAGINWDSPGLVASVNRLATLGAIYRDDDAWFVGARLTVFEGEQAETLHFPLLLCSIIDSSASLSAAVEPNGDGAERLSASSWRLSDFELARASISEIAWANASANGLTAEFPLSAGAVSASLGHGDTALWQLTTDQPHPCLGAGLLCTLEMPHQILTTQRLDALLDSLNQMEMAPHDLPPHFGAWTRGRLGNTPAYVTFLPNALHSVAGIALNQSIWAFSRAQWADAMLRSMSIGAHRY